MVQLKALARRWDKSASEIIRLAIERLLSQVPGEIGPNDEQPPAPFKSFELGKILASSGEMRELLSKRHNDR